MAMLPKRTTLNIRDDLFFRLRWNILEPLEEVKIATGTYDQPIYVPLFGHPLADESFADPPISRIERLRHSESDYNDLEILIYSQEEWYKEPPTETIDNEDSPITLGQFITQTHAYLNTQVELIKRSKGKRIGEDYINENGVHVRSFIYGKSCLPPDTAIFFRRVCAQKIDQIVQVCVKLYAEGEIYDYTTDRFFAVQLQQSRRHEQGHKYIQ
jgi:hypothetical protein